MGYDSRLVVRLRYETVTWQLPPGSSELELKTQGPKPWLVTQAGVCVCAHGMCMCVYMRTCVYMCVCARVCMRVHACVHTCGTCTLAGVVSIVPGVSLARWAHASSACPAARLSLHPASPRGPPVWSVRCAGRQTWEKRRGLLPPHLGRNPSRVSLSFPRCHLLQHLQSPDGSSQTLSPQAPSTPGSVLLPFKSRPETVSCG